MDDRRLEIQIGTLLRAGVLVAAGTVLLGGIVYLAQNHAEPIHYSTFQEEGFDLRTLAGITRSALHFRSEGLIQLGILLLIATPVARVVFAVVGFALEKDRLYTIVSLIVLAILAFSLMHAT